MKKPTIAFAGLTACFGCQLTLFNCEPELTEIADSFRFVHFPMGISNPHLEEEIDATLIEGAVSTPADLEALIRLRARSRRLIAVGTCARWGGINALKNREARLPLVKQVYGPRTWTVDTFNPGPVNRFVSVDGYVTGCPPETQELLALLTELLFDQVPVFEDYPVCIECRKRENLCLLMERNQLCLGPLIQAGCHARCPTVGIPCEGCRGPVAEANVAAEVNLLLGKGYSGDEVTSRMRRFCVEWINEIH